MSSQLNDTVSPRLWRSAVCALGIVIGVTMLAVVLIAHRTPPIDPVRFDERWQIQSGVVGRDRLLLRPAAGFASIGLALSPSESITYTLQARFTIEPPQATAGLIVHAKDANHFLAFLISNDGYFAVGEMRDGTWSERMPWRAWPHIRRGTESNVLRAECDTAACVFFVNDEWTWREGNLPGGSAIGFIARPTDAGTAPATVTIDQIGAQARP